MVIRRFIKSASLATIITVSFAVSSRIDVLANDERFASLENNVISESKNKNTIHSNSTDSTRNIRNSDTNERNQGFQCGIYLATSSIPNAGFGIYTTRSIARFEKVQPYSEAPSIAITDFYATFRNEEADWGHSQYYWDGSGNAAYEGDEVHESVMTFGSLCNYHPILMSLFPSIAEYEDDMLDRYNSPGAGAISYHGRQFVTTRDIEAGEELFDDYGDHWLDNRPGTYADYVPRRKDYRMAAAALARLNKANKKFNDKELSMVAKTISVFSERAASVFPDTATKHRDFIRMTNQLLKKYKIDRISSRDLPFYLAKSNLARRDTDWIRNNGICIEKIRPAKSTIPDAGRGAFAQMSMETGDIIVPAPLLNIPNKDSLLMYQSEIDSEGNRVKVDDEPIGYQLLMNYCFGHTESKLILCPQTNAILINHCSTRHKEGANTCNNGNGPNARVQWASGWDPNTKDWLQKSMEEIKELTANGQRGLSLEVVAMSDIAPGDEIFIDYGESWENAWNAHVEDWNSMQKQDKDDNSYIPVQVLIDNRDYRTLEEQETNPYPENIQLLCYGGKLIETKGHMVNPNGRSNEGKIVTVNGPDGFEPNSSDDISEPSFLFPCYILQRDRIMSSTDEYEYDVQIYFEERNVKVRNYPEESLVIAQKGYTSDQHLEGAFRHFMEIDDDIFPSHWKQE